MDVIDLYIIIGVVGFADNYGSNKVIDNYGSNKVIDNYGSNKVVDS